MRKERLIVIAAVIASFSGTCGKKGCVFVAGNQSKKSFNNIHKSPIPAIFGVTFKAPASKSPSRNRPMCAMNRKKDTPAF